MKEMNIYMKEFKKVNKTLIKSNNTTTKIFNRYLYCLIPFILLIIISNLISRTSNNIMSLLISITVSIFTSSLTQIIFNSIKKENNNIKDIFITQNSVPYDELTDYDQEFMDFIGLISKEGEEPYRVVASFNNSTYATVRFGDLFGDLYE